MSYKNTLYLFIILFTIIFLVDYFLINKKRLYLIENKGINKSGKKKKIKQLGELDYLVGKFKLDQKKLDKNRVIFWISIINSFIISFVSSIIMLIPLKLMWQMLIAFAMLFGLIYALYEIMGRSLKRKEESFNEHE